MIKIYKTFKSLQDVVLVDNDGKVEIYAMVEDEADAYEAEDIIKRLETAFQLKLEK